MPIGKSRLISSCRPIELLHRRREQGERAGNNEQTERRGERSERRGERAERREGTEGRCQGEEPEQLPTLAPTLVHSEPQLPTVEGVSQVPIENVGDDGAREDSWSQLIADIRTQSRC